MSNETLTRNESQSMLDDIKREVAKIEALIKEKKVVGATVEFLDEKKVLLQKQLDKILKKGGIITEDDYNESYNLLRAKEQKELLDSRDKARKKLVMWFLIGAGIIVGVWYLTKKK